MVKNGDGGALLRTMRGELAAVAARWLVMILMPLLVAAFGLIYNIAQTIVLRLDSSIERLSDGLHATAANVDHLDQSIKIGVTQRVEVQQKILEAHDHAVADHELRLRDLERAQLTTPARPPERRTIAPPTNRAASVSPQKPPPQQPAAVTDLQGFLHQFLR